MKFQTGCPYILHEHFDSPLWGFLEDKKNTEIVDEVIEKWLQPTLIRSRLKKGEDFFMESMTMVQIWLPYKKDDNWIYVSWIYLIIKRIVEYFLSKLPDPMNPDPIIKLLNGYMYHEYHTTWKYGDKLFDIIDEAMVSKEEKKPMKEEGRKAVSVRNEIIPSYLDEIDTGKEKKDSSRIDRLLKKIKKGEDFKFSEDDFRAIEKIFWRKTLLLGVNNEWTDFAKRAGFSEERIKWLKQTRIKRGTKFTMTLLVAIITNIYFEKELFLYYNPYMYEMWICDRKWLELTRPDVYLFVDFWKVIRTLFCEHCFQKFIWKNKLKFDDKSKDNKETIKNMFDDLYNLATDVCPDDLNITMEGKVNDKNRYLEVDKAVEFGKVGFDKYAGEKWGVVFSVNKDLKKYKKKIK